MSTPTIQPIRWKDDAVVLLDQRRLPTEEVYVTYHDYQGVADAIRHMVVRGAPAIGVAAAMGMALGAMGIGVTHYDAFMERLHAVARTLTATRPTAVNLAWAIERMLRVAGTCATLPLPAIVSRMKDEALAIYHEDIETNRCLGRHGQALFAHGDVVLTHCNAGELATAGWGTALSVLYHAQEAGKQLHVFVDETRPFLQGARLTAWELQKHGMQATLITDSMAAWCMQQGRIHKVIVGADRIAANGDVANKIGTYGLAVLARHHDIPFYVAAPRSTIDPATPTGHDIPIEERDPREVTHIGNLRIAPTHIDVYNPAFDITPAAFVTAIITDAGIVEPPFAEKLGA